MENEFRQQPFPDISAGNALPSTQVFQIFNTQENTHCGITSQPLSL